MMGRQIDTKKKTVSGLGKVNVTNFNIEEHTLLDITESKERAKRMKQSHRIAREEYYE